MMVTGRPKQTKIGMRRPSMCPRDTIRVPMVKQLGLLLFLVVAPPGPLERGEALLEKGDLVGAAAAFSEAAKAAPKDARPIYYLGTIAMRKGDAPGAVAQYKKATALDPKLSEAWSNWAV